MNHMDTLSTNKVCGLRNFKLISGGITTHDMYTYIKPMKLYEKNNTTLYIKMYKKPQEYVQHQMPRKISAYLITNLCMSSKVLDTSWLQIEMELTKSSNEVNK